MAAIIFDFDGTIADSFDYVSDFMAREAGINKLSDEQKQSLRSLSMTDMAKKLGYHWWSAPMLFLKGRHRMQKAIRHLEPVDGMPDLMRKLHAEGHELFILSTNSLRNISRFLHHHKLHIYFLEIYGGAGIFGKARALRRLLKQQQFKTEQAVYVGDERRDVEAARAIRMRVIAVTWGFAARSDLKAHHPTAMADTPDELMRVLEEV